MFSGNRKLAKWVAGAMLVFGSVFVTAAPAAAVVFTPPTFYSSDGGARNDQIKVTFDSAYSAKITWRLSDIKSDGKIPNSTVRFYYANTSSTQFETFACRGGSGSTCTYTRADDNRGKPTRIVLSVCNAWSYCVEKGYDNPHN